MFELPVRQPTAFLPAARQMSSVPSFPGERIRRVQELRRSSAASRHVPAPRKPTRTQVRRRAIKEQEC